jgi:hypothetical protein
MMMAQRRRDWVLAAMLGGAGALYANDSLMYQFLVEFASLCASAVKWFELTFSAVDSL